MNEFTKKIFLGEIQRQCEYTKIAYNNIAKIEKSELRAGLGTKLVFFYIQSFLVSYANISKILWSDKKNKQAYQRAKEIRKLLAIPDSSLFHYGNRKIRDDFEHFDQRLDELDNTASKNKRYIFVDCNIASPDRIIPGTDKSLYFRNYYGGYVYFWGRKPLHLHSIIQEISELQTKVEKNFNE